MFDLTLQPVSRLVDVDAMEDQEPSVDHDELHAVRHCDRVITEEVSMSLLQQVEEVKTSVA